MTLLTLLNRLPPYLVKAMAKVRPEPVNGKKQPRRGIYVSEIADATGLAKSTVLRIAARDDWNGVTVEHASDFIMACGVDMFSRHTARKLREATGYDKPFRHLSKAQRKALDRRLNGGGA